MLMSREPAQFHRVSIFAEDEHLHFEVTSDLAARRGSEPLLSDNAAGAPRFEALFPRLCPAAKAAWRNWARAPIQFHQRAPLRQTQLGQHKQAAQARLSRPSDGGAL